jgi:hypothetical protein
MGVPISISLEMIIQVTRALNQGSFEHKVECDKSLCEEIGNFLVGPGVDSTDISSVSLINRIIFKVLIKSIIPREGSETKMSWVHKYLIKLLNQETPINLSLYQPAYIFHHLCSSVRKFQKSPEGIIHYARLLSIIFEQVGFFILFHTFQLFK